MKLTTREKFTIKTSTPTCRTSKRQHLKFEQKSPVKFVKVFAKPLPSREQNFPHFPLLVKGKFITQKTQYNLNPK
jgi:hypothetical protein